MNNENPSSLAAQKRNINTQPQALLRKHGLFASKKYSQNFLTSSNMIERICSAFADPKPNLIVELGPGLGALTKRLLSEGVSVIGIEKDPNMLSILKEEFASEPLLELKKGDAAHVDFGDLCPTHENKVSVIGNLPYAITGPILRNLSFHRAFIQKAVLMVQKEVAERLLSEPGKKTYGALTVFITAVFKVTLVTHVSPGHFHPVPKVFSSVLEFLPKQNPVPIESESFQNVVHSAFEYRRKKFRNALLQKFKDSSFIDSALSAAQIDGTRRGETLSVEEFWRLATVIDQL